MQLKNASHSFMTGSKKKDQAVKLSSVFPVEKILPSLQPCVLKHLAETVFTVS